MTTNAIKQGIAVALCASFAMWAGAASASLVGDTVTVGHYSPPAHWKIGMPPSSFIVEAGNADTYVFYNSYPFGYQVNVEANSILVDFSSTIQPGETATWQDTYESCGFIGGILECNTAPLSFNGLMVSDLNDSSGNPLQNVVIDTNMAGWDSSRLTIESSNGRRGATSNVQFDWKGLSFNNATYFNATLDFGQVAAAVPEPETYAMLLAGLGLLGFTARRNKKRAA